MLKKYAFFLLFFALTAFSFGCSGSDESDVTDQEAQEISSKVNMAVIMAMGDVRTHTGTKTIQSNSGTYNNSPYWIATYSYSYDDTNTYPITYNVSFTFLGYSYNGVTLSSGTTNVTWSMSSANNFQYSSTGSLVVTYNGETYDYSWDVNISFDGTNYSYSGTCTINGTEYSLTYSGAY